MDNFVAVKVFFSRYDAEQAKGLLDVGLFLVSLPRSE